MEFRGPLASDYFSSSSSDRVNNYSNKDYSIVNTYSSSHVPGINPLNSSSSASSIVLSPATTTSATATLIGGAPVPEPMHRNIGGRSPKMGPSSGGLSLPIGSSEYGSSGLAKLKSSSSDLYSKQQQYLSRATSLDQMDLQAALDQMRIILSLAPYRVYKTSYYRKQTKNHWSRDDPAFCVLEVLFLLVASVSYNIAFRQQQMFLSTIIFALQHIFGIFFGCGAIVATLGQYVSNNYLSHLPNNSNGGTAGGGSSTSGSTHHVQQKVEWMYAFDIHCNAFLPFFVVLYALQFFLLPIVLGKSFFALILSNTMYAGAFSWYFYISHLGYRALPFLTNTEVFLLPIVPVLVLYVLNFIGHPFGLGFNASRLMAHLYFD